MRTAVKTALSDDGKTASSDVWRPDVPSCSGWAARLLVVAVAALLVGGIALAPSSAEAKRRRSKASRTVSFEDDIVETSYLRPESSVIESINSRTRTSLIRIRMDFFKEIVRSATKL